VWIPVRSDEIDDFHLVATHLPGEVTEQGMQHRDFQLRGVEGKQREKREGEKAAKHDEGSRGTIVFASKLRLMEVPCPLKGGSGFLR
jgi:hypothetical protein